MASNLYKVGDWVFCETSPFQPFVIRKIEELTKTPSGNVEAKVIFAFRRQDIPAAVMASVEKYQQKNSEKKEGDGDAAQSTCEYEESEVSDLNELQRYQLKHRQVYYSKYSDTIAATSIRAKCSVLLFNEEVERYSDYVTKDESFYYHLTYDPYQKSIVADKGEIRVGLRYQAEIPAMKVATANGSIIESSDSGDDAQLQTSGERALSERVLRSQLQKMTEKQKEQNIKEMPEVPIAEQTDDMFQWCPLGQKVNDYSNQLTESDVDKYLILAKSVGTYARALDCNNACKQPSLPLSAACASRDITSFHALNTLHENNYDVGKAALSLITSNGPVISKDQIEEWSANEANLFEDAMEKYGKDFHEIRKDFLPWKNFKSIIEYYYSWKTTDRYVQQKRIKIIEQESKLKQVYIPNSKQSQSALIKQFHLQIFQQFNVLLKSSCESCGTPTSSTNQWFVHNPSSLVQLIMTGNQNQQQLSAAAAAAQAQAQANNPNNHNNGQNVTLYQARLCGECWNYWKRNAAFKFPNARQERLNQLKNQVHKCSVNGCGREFKLKQALVKHCGVAHGYFAKTNVPVGPNSPRPLPMRNKTSLYLHTTPMTRSARLVCTKTIRLFKLARKPFKLVDLGELNKEWQKESRNITKLLEEYNKTKKAKSEKLTVELIDNIRKARANHLKKVKKLSNGHGKDENEEDNEELVIDNDDDADKPEFLKYFKEKAKEPCYTPETILYTKPTTEQVNKFFMNLMSQNRKRAHEQAGTNPNDSKQTDNSANDSSSPLSKRSLLNNNGGQVMNHLGKSSQLNNGQNKTAGAANANAIKPATARLPTKSMKPTQSANLVNGPLSIYYVSTTAIKTLRKDVKSVSLKKLARKPYKLIAKQYQAHYATLAKIETDSLAKANEKKKQADENGTDKSEKKSEKMTNGSAATATNGDSAESKAKVGKNENDEVTKDSIIIDDTDTSKTANDASETTDGQSKSTESNGTKAEGGDGDDVTMETGSGEEEEKKKPSSQASNNGKENGKVGQNGDSKNDEENECEKNGDEGDKSAKKVVKEAAAADMDTAEKAVT